MCAYLIPCARANKITTVDSIVDWEIVRATSICDQSSAQQTKCRLTVLCTGSYDLLLRQMQVRGAHVMADTRVGRGTPRD